MPPQHAPAPLPPLTGLLGSIETADARDYSAQLYLQPLPIDAADDFIHRTNAALLAAGWRVPQMRWPTSQPSGFVASDRPDFPARPTDLTLAQPEQPAQRLIHDGAGLGATWDSRAEGAQTHLCFNIQAGLYRHLVWEEEDSPLPTLPALSAPAGWTLEVIGGGGNGGGRASHASSLALLRGTGSAQELYAHFGGQLEGQGWTEQSAAGNDTLTASVWHTPDGDLALLTLSGRGPGLWQASLGLTRLLGEAAEGRSWFSF
ncbi:hypothetical protein ACFP81_04855 [Deinococcus lacus]|uniref:DUF317 domain-containing protein n=1 Tax=Deinococcus lacus TaxID=392561 RepID=A0ABW1YAQ9_9DEIO